MKYELSYDPELDLIVGKIEGEIDPSIVKTMAAEFAELAKSTGCLKLLNDLRSAHITPAIFDIYDIPRIIDNLGVPITCQRALLVSELSKDFGFLETVSKNVGHNIRIFNDKEAALQWLNAGQVPDNQPTEGDA